MSFSRVISYDYLHGGNESDAASSLSELAAEVYGSSVDSGVTSEESVAPPPTVTQKRFQKKLSNDQIRTLLQTFYNEARAPDSKLSINKFADCRQIPKGTFKGILKASGLGDLFTSGSLKTESNLVVQNLITDYLAQRSASEKKRKNQSHNNFLTDDEQSLLLAYCTKLAIFGNCINRKTLLQLTNALVNMSVDRRDGKPCTMAVVKKMLKTHPGLLSLVNASSIDPQRAKKATEDVRDHYFMKIENFVKLTKNIGLHTWKSAAEVPARNIYNMDEKSLNAANGFEKVRFYFYFYILRRKCYFFIYLFVLHRFTPKTLIKCLFC